ncbi:MAG: hypothetical protein RLZ98_2203 [Pseudomonadota bacterium]|jgi:tripartite-type tricarboxylate transporter receptor subunit TctC
MKQISAAVAVALSLTCLQPSLTSTQAAETPADFYKGKKIKMFVGSKPGGGYDGYARHVTRHIGKYIPGNPTFIVQNMPGGGGMRVTNFLYNIADKDGTAMGVIQRGLLVSPLLETRNLEMKFDPLKFNWLGSLNTETGLIVVWHTTPHTKFEDLKTKELLVGSSGPATEYLPRLLNNVFGTKLKIISGYQSSTEAYLAMERGEVTGRVSTGWAGDREILTPWIKENKVRFLVQLSLKKNPDFPNVPLITDFARNDSELRIMELVLSSQLWGRPFLMPPNVPKDRVAAVRKAFINMTKDKEFLEDAKRLRLDLEVITGEEIDTRLGRVYATPKDVVDKTRELLK